jgi:hypothetical protein
MSAVSAKLNTALLILQRGTAVTLSDAKQHQHCIATRNAAELISYYTVLCYKLRTQ